MKRFVLLSGFLFVGVGCGEVLLPGTGGAGGAGSTTGSATSTTTSGGKAPCEKFCDNFGSCVATPNCLATCEAIIVPGCTAQANAAIECLAEKSNAAKCVLNSCPAESEVLQTCKGEPQPGCQASQNCHGDNEKCDCLGTCNGSTVEVTCEVQPNGTALCNCYRSLGLTTTCTQPSLDSCSLDSGCCAQAFE